MLIIETYLDMSPGKGIGLFSKNNVPAGTTYWVRNELFDRSFPPEIFNKLEKLASDYIKVYGFLEISGNWFLCGDNARFTNHSDLPNTTNYFDVKGIIQYSTVSAALKKGDEILCDYAEICQSFRNEKKFLNEY